MSLNLILSHDLPLRQTPTNLTTKIMGLSAVDKLNAYEEFCWSCGIDFVPSIQDKELILQAQIEWPCNNRQIHSLKDSFRHLDYNVDEWDNIIHCAAHINNVRTAINNGAVFSCT